MRNLWQKKCPYEFYTVHFAFLNMYTKFESTGSKSVTEISIGEKEKWTNKRTDKQYVAKMVISILISIYSVHFAFLNMYIKFENTGSNRCWEICDRNFHWR